MSGQQGIISGAVKIKSNLWVLIPCCSTLSPCARDLEKAGEVISCEWDTLPKRSHASFPKYSNLVIPVVDFSLSHRNGHPTPLRSRVRGPDGPLGRIG